MKTTKRTCLIKTDPMKQVNYSFEYEVYDSEMELQAPDRDLLRQAMQAVAGSYAPYSRYHVGAAVKLVNGRVITGSNQENMSFPAGLCAERVAVFAAVSAYPETPVEAIAITAVSDVFEVSEPVSPCGVCRQAIVEYEMKFGNKIRLILGGQTGRVFVFNGMSSLLPLAFREKGLAK